MKAQWWEVRRSICFCDETSCSVCKTQQTQGGGGGGGGEIQATETLSSRLKLQPLAGFATLSLKRTPGGFGSFVMQLRARTVTAYVQH